MQLRLVDPSKPATAALLRYLQLQILPFDEPTSTERGWWWVAYDYAKLPVGFAGLRQVHGMPEYGYLCRSGVLPSHRGQGLQLKFIRVRERRARRLGLRVLVTDTLDNPRSANNLIRAGFRMYRPQGPWGAPGACYWRKEL